MRLWILGLMISSLIGVIGFLVIYPTSILNPNYIAWLLQNGDCAQSFLGFAFFKNEPWHWPPGLIRGFSYPEMTSLVYTASSPIFAFIMKLLPVNSNFQFYGPLIFLSFILQGAFGFRLLYFYHRSWINSVLGSAFLVFLPAFLIRGYNGFSFTQQYGLLPHFLILSALFYVFHPKYNKNLWIWTGLLILSLGVHFYLAFIIGIFFVSAQASTLQGYRWRNGYLGVFIALILACYLYGYFVIPLGSAASWGFGMLSMNLNSLFNPMDKSLFIPTLQLFDGQYEGYQYLGLGLIILSVVYLRKDSWQSLTPPIQFGVLFVLFLSLSFQITFFHWMLSERISKFIIFAICAYFLRKNKMPLWLCLLIPVGLIYLMEKVGPTLRASGRLFWGIEYLMVFLIFQKKPKTIIVAGLLTLQIADISQHFFTIQNRNTSFFKFNMPEPLLGFIPKDTYTHIAFMSGDEEPKWEVLSYYANSDQKTIGPLPLARSNLPVKLAELKKLDQEVLELRPKLKTLYLVGSQKTWNEFIFTCMKNQSACKKINYGSKGTIRFLYTQE